MLRASQLLRVPHNLQADEGYDTRDFDTAEPKPRMEENQKSFALHLNGNGRDSDHLKSGIGKDEYFFNAPEYECSIIMDDFTTGTKETEVTDSLTFRKGTHFYTDTKITECELPELIVCYKENTYHDIKDICIDEGVPSEKKNDTEFLFKDGKKSISRKDSNVIDCGAQKNADKSSSESDPGVAVEAGKENSNATDADIINDASREELVSNNLLSVKDIRPQTSLEALFESSSDACGDVGQQRGQKSLMEAVPEKKKCPSSILCYDSKVESGTITFNFRCRKTASSTSKNSEIVVEQPNVLINENFCEDVRTSSHVNRGEGESSRFSVAGPSSGLITYSGQIPFSGSISLRSDSSTTSTQSFAFPVLQPEWSSSPVRMAKADRRHFRKHRGWRLGLLCCRF